MLAGVKGSGIRLAELMMALSMATDLGMGQPLQTALRASAVFARLPCWPSNPDHGAT
jgi:hypothetical protein